MILSNIYDGAFLEEKLTTAAKNFIIDVRPGPKYSPCLNTRTKAIILG